MFPDILIHLFVIEILKKRRKKKAAGGKVLASYSSFLRAVVCEAEREWLCLWVQAGRRDTGTSNSRLPTHSGSQHPSLAGKIV